MKRENQFKVLLSDEERRELERLAASRGLTASDWVRQQVRAESAKLPAKKARR